MHPSQEKLIRRSTITTALAIALVLAAAPARAEGQGHHPGHPGSPEGAPLQRMLDGLDLTREQADALKQPLQAHHEAMEANFDRMRGARTALEGAIRADTFDEAAIRRAAQSVAGVEADMAVSRAAILRDIRKVLTPEQLEKLGAMRERRHEMMGERFPGGPGAPRRPRNLD